jgi:hypothetical protein
MNIIELAKEAGYRPLEGFEFANALEEDFLKRFAALVRADEREKVKKVLMAAHELSKPHHNYYHYIALQLDDAMEKLK